MKVRDESVSTAAKCHCGSGDNQKGKLMKARDLIPVRSSLNGIVPSRDELFYPFEQYFNSMFDNFFNSDGLMSIKSRVGYPKLDVLTEDGKWVVEAAMPGVPTEDVTVEILPAKDGSHSILKISGRMAEDHQYEKATFHVKELRRSSFERSLVLPDYVKGEPDACMKNGILRLTWEVPDLKAPQKKTIKIRSEE